MAQTMPLERRATVSFDDGRVWEPYVSLHFLGASHYAK